MNQPQTAKYAINQILHDKTISRGEGLNTLKDIESHLKAAIFCILLEDRPEKGAETTGEKTAKDRAKESQEGQEGQRCNFGILTKDLHCPNAATYQTRRNGLVFCEEHKGEHDKPIGGIASSRKTKRVG